MARVASVLRIPSVIVELRIFEWREELENKGRAVRRIASQVAVVRSATLLSCTALAALQSHATCHESTCCVQIAVVVRASHYAVRHSCFQTPIGQDQPLCLRICIMAHCTLRLQSNS